MRRVHAQEPTVGLFGRKKSEEPAAAAGEAAPGGAVTSSPEKAAKFFEHARTTHETENFEYAMQLWLGGLRNDPASMPGLEGFLRSAAAFAGPSGAGRPTRELQKAFSGRGEVEAYLTALLEHGVKPLDPERAVRAAKAAGVLGLPEPGVYLAKRALAVAMKDAKPRKDWFVQLMQIFQKLASFEFAVTAGERAVALDPADGRLAAEIRNLAAQATMSKGNYSQTGQEGGFRANIRDADRQRRLEEEARLGRTEETADRLLQSAREEYEARPSDKPTLKKYVQRLLERGTPEDERAALEVLQRAYAETQEYYFRQQAGEIQLRRARRKLAAIRDAAQRAPDDAAAQQTLRDAERQFLEFEIRELEARAAAYPGDLAVRFELGRRFFDAGRFEDAIGAFQEAKSDPKNRGTVLNQLARSFQAIGWHDEAAETFRQALEVVAENTDPALLMELRYGLMVSLTHRAQDSRDIGAGEEAYRLASAIAIQQINFRDVRQRREQIKALLASLRQGGAA